MLEWLKFWKKDSFDQMVEGFGEIARVRWGSPYPTREPDQALEFLSQPIDGERSPQTQQITRELTGGLSERER
jgi:hypothetical protein